MNNNLRCLLFIVIEIVSLTSLITADNKPFGISTNYFPIESNVAMLYKSSFGETITVYFQDGEFAISSSEADEYSDGDTRIVKVTGQVFDTAP